VRWFRRHRGSQSEAPTPNCQVPVAFGSSLSFYCSCGGSMHPTALIAMTETSKTFHITCGGCKRTLDVILDVADAVKALARSPYRVPLSGTARQVIARTLAQNPDIAAQPDYLQTLVDYILIDLGEAGLEIVAREDVE